MNPLNDIAATCCSAVSCLLVTRISQHFLRWCRDYQIPHPQAAISGYNPETGERMQNVSGFPFPHSSEDIDWHISEVFLYLYSEILEGALH